MSVQISPTRALSVRRVLAMAGAGALAAAGLLALAAPEAHAAETCPDVEVVFARGTAEPAGVGSVGQGFVDALRAEVPNRTVSVYAVNYPASYDFLKAADGANDASAHVQATAAACPNTSIVLGGFSQGAAVIDFITADPGPLFGFGSPCRRGGGSCGSSGCLRQSPGPVGSSAHRAEPVVRREDHRPVQRSRPGLLGRRRPCRAQSVCRIRIDKPGSGFRGGAARGRQRSRSLITRPAAARGEVAPWCRLTGCRPVVAERHEHGVAQADAVVVEEEAVQATNEVRPTWPDADCGLDHRGPRCLAQVLHDDRRR